MYKNLFTTFVFAIALAFGFQNISAQFTITIPKIPKIKKPKTEQPKQEEPTPEQPKSEQPTTVNDSQKSDEMPKKSEATCESEPFIGVYLKDIKGTQKQAEEFRPGLRDYYVSTLSDRKNEYMEVALSQSQRKEYDDKWKKSPEYPKYVKCIAPALDELAVVARKTLPSYTGPAGYTLGTPAEKKALLSAIKDIGEAKVLKVGLQQANWLIEKDSYNFPTARYKYGVIWAKYPNSEDGFCRIFWVNLVQDYAGGGTYGASYGNFVARSYAGCPAGK